jgi:hypothetical protein
MWLSCPISPFSNLWSWLGGWGPFRELAVTVKFMVRRNRIFLDQSRALIFSVVYGYGYGYGRPVETL